jgi:hypothetical protein
MAGCGKKMKEYVPRGYDYKEITVRCGSTSPYGSPWLCDKCEEIHGHRDWRREAEEAGEQWDDDY